MRILGLDLGSKTLGIAISDNTKTISTPLTTYRFKSGKYYDALDEVGKLLEENEIEKIVLGYPKNMDNSIGERALICEEFKTKIEEKYDISVVLQDERLSTVAAENILINHDLSRKKRKTVIDSLAASLILQNYLDSQKK